MQAWQNDSPQLGEVVRRGTSFYSIALLLSGQNSIKVHKSELDNGHTLFEGEKNFSISKRFHICHIVS